VASLDTLGATYTLEQCDEALSDTREWCEAYGHTVGSSTSCIILASKMEPKQYGCCLVMADRRVDVNKKARSLMGLSKKNRPSFATADETTALTGMTPGGVCPFGLPDDLPLFVDGAVLKSGEHWAATPGTQSMDSCDRGRQRAVLASTEFIL
jgi:prolyl-tRNA editing enzyme YbaK/EbsC (Cys-tRNA(Pro) deacylase)